MAHETEAACLLRTGAMYRRRIGLRSDSGELVFVGVNKHGSLSLYFDDEPIYHTDLEGRWQRAYLAGTHYRKALDGSIDAIARPREGKNLVLRRRPLPFAEASDLDARVRQAALDLIEGVESGRLTPVPPPESVPPIDPEELRELLERIARWDSAAWFRHRETYISTYGPLGFLPPDCHGAIVLQATLGHPGARAFGNAPPAEHYVRSPEEFAEHAHTVRNLLGRRVEQSRGAFLAGADVLRQPVDQVAAYLKTIAEVFPERDGVDAFLDDVAPPLPDRDAWRRLADLGLRRVNLGIESGDADVRALYRKTWSDDDLRATVADLNAAGLGLRLMLLVGAGGVSWADRHEAATAELLNTLDLQRGDLVYLLDANEIGDASFGGQIEPLTGSRWNEQQARLKERLVPIRAGCGAKVVPYLMEKQWN